MGSPPAAAGGRKEVNLQMPGRKFKEGLDYFELDCHMDEKVRLIQAEFGLKGFAVIVLLLQEIYGGRGYYMSWDDDRSLLFMSENGVTGGDKNLIQDIVAACIRRNIFSEELFHKYQILTSSGIQKRYLNAVARREKVELKKEYLLINVDINRISVDIKSISANRNEENVDRNAQRKEEKRREEERKEKKKPAPPPVYYPNDEALDKTFKDFIEFRKKIKHPLTDRAMELIQKDIEKLASVNGIMDNDLAIRILEQSIKRGWRGVFPLKEEDQRPRQQTNTIDWRNV